MSVKFITASGASAKLDALPARLELTIIMSIAPHRAAETGFHERSRATRERLAFLPALLLLLISALAMAALAARPGAPGSQVAVQFAPWLSTSSTALAVADAGGEIVRQGAWPSLLVVRSDDPDFIARLHKSGAWAVFNPLIVGGCAATANTSQ